MFQAIFNQLSEPRIVLYTNAPDFTVMAFNAAYERATRDLAVTVIGESFWNIFRNGDTSVHTVSQFRSALETVVQTGASFKLPPFRFDWKDASGIVQQRWWELELCPFHDPMDQQQYIMCTTWDISERVESNKARERHDRVQNMLLGMQEKISEDLEQATEQVTTITEAKQQLERSADQLRQANRELQQARQLLEQAISTADMGTWTIDMKTGILEMSPRIRQMFGLPGEGPVSVEAAMAAVDPNYHDRVNKEMAEGLTQFKDIMVEYPLTNLLTRKKIWVRGTGKMFFGTDGMPLHFSGLFIDITRQKEDEERMNTFIAIVSHELKTPLTAAKGFLQLLERKIIIADDTDCHHLVVKTIAQTDRMNRLIDAYLDSSRLEAGRIELQLSSFSLNELISGIILEQKLINHFPNITFTSCEPKNIIADREKIGQVISNFVGNAVKYSPAHTEVSVTCDYTDTEATVQVTDRGIGISPADQEHIFERFYRVGSIPSPPVGSFGIGLYLCAEIIHRHNGQIDVLSKPGEGATFRLKIPLRPGE